MTHTMKETLWIQFLLREVFSNIGDTTTLFGDNQSAIALVKDHQYYACTKHIDIHYHFIPINKTSSLSTALLMTWLLMPSQSHSLLLKSYTLPLSSDFDWFEGECSNDCRRLSLPNQVKDPKYILKICLSFLFWYTLFIFSASDPASPIFVTCYHLYDIYSQDKEGGGGYPLTGWVGFTLCWLSGMSPNSQTLALATIIISCWWLILQADFNRRISDLRHKIILTKLMQETWIFTGLEGVCRMNIMQNCMAWLY